MRLPGDKSIAIRAALLASIARAPWRLSHVPASADVRCALAAVAAAGARVDVAGDIVAIEAGSLPPTVDANAGGSATLLRLGAGLWSTRPTEARWSMDASLAGRPHARFCATLARLVGADALERDGALLRVRGRELRGDFDITTLDDSAQQKSALLLAALALDGRLTVRQTRPTRAHTEEMLRALGATLSCEDASVTLVGPFSPGALDAALPADPSSAALLAVAVAPGGAARFEDVCASPLRLGFFDVLGRMGARVRIERGRTSPLGPVADVSVEGGELVGVDVAAEDVPALVDEVPALACACALARGPSRLRGLAALRGKESDRVASTAALLRAFAVGVREDGDDLVIEGRPRAFTAPAIAPTAHDHRIAMAALALGRALGFAVELDDRACIDKSYPGFEHALDDVAPPH